MHHGGIVAVDPRAGKLNVWPTGRFGGGSASRLVAWIRRPEDVGLDSSESLCLVVANAYTAGCGRQSSVD